MDITTDGFGFMLSVGDLAWVPFVYSLQARYLAFTPVELGPVWTTAVFLVNLTGYYIFRDANGEKNDFRNGKNPKSECALLCGGGEADCAQTSNSSRLRVDRSCSRRAGGGARATRTTCASFDRGRCELC